MADTQINGVNVPFVPIGGLNGPKQRGPFDFPPERSFEEVLDGELSSLKFSKHAQERLDARKIQLDEQDLSNLNQAVAKAEEKGANESLILLRDMAFIVSVKNKMVVTAIDGDRLRENVFTNIDSAVIAA